MSENDVKPDAKPAKMGAVAAICDALKELFEHAPKNALGWVCAGVALFIALCGVGIMTAFIMYGWPTMADKELQNWEVMTTKAGISTVEVRGVDNAGVMNRHSVEVPKGEADPKAWAVSRYGEQKPLTRMSMIPMDKKSVLDNKTSSVPKLKDKP